MKFWPSLAQPCFFGASDRHRQTTQAQTAGHKDQYGDFGGLLLLTIVSIHSVQKYAVQGLTNMDPMRLAAQIVSGVGFIGAGVILRRSNDMISGLTTAAMVWAASALGIASGAGFYTELLPPCCSSFWQSICSRLSSGCWAPRS